MKVDTQKLRPGDLCQEIEIGVTSQDWFLVVEIDKDKIILLDVKHGRTFNFYHARWNCVVYRLHEPPNLL